MSELLVQRRLRFSQAAESVHDQEKGFQRIKCDYAAFTNEDVNKHFKEVHIQESNLNAISVTMLHS